MEQSWASDLPGCDWKIWKKLDEGRGKTQRKEPQPSSISCPEILCQAQTEQNRLLWEEGAITASLRHPLDLEIRLIKFEIIVWSDFLKLTEGQLSL